MDRTERRGTAAASERPRRRETAAGAAERYIAGVPARIMRPRLVFIVCLVALVLFGLLMVYSASAVEALAEEGSSIHFLVRQAVFAVVGAVAAFLIARGFPWTLKGFREGGTRFLTGAILLLLLAVLAMGASAGGAQRWISIGFFSLQPSELAKPVIILFAADLFSRYFEERTITWGPDLWLPFLIGVGAPLLLIMLQRDTGSTAIIAATVVCMALLSGMPLKNLLVAGAILAVLLGAYIAMEPYRLSRIAVSLDPWADPYGNGYQATLAIMAFASGGLTGRGIGGSTMKYSYLPEAHNDYIFAIIGEELGLVGTLLFILVFLMLVYAGFKIAGQTPRLYEKLVAAGCSMALGIQFFVNILGILAVTPMTGKPIPFISYGGSSMLASLILAGLIIRVSVESPTASPYRARRERFAVMGEGEPGDEADVSSHLGRSTAGAVSSRSGAARSRGFNVYDGGAAARPRPSAPPGGRTRPPAGGWDRIDLNADPADRLRERRPPYGGGPRSRRGREDRYDR